MILPWLNLRELIKRCKNILTRWHVLWWIKSIKKWLRKTKRLLIMQSKTRQTCQINLNAVILSLSRNSMRRTEIKWITTRVAKHRKRLIKRRRSSKIVNLSLQILTQILYPSASHCKSAQKRLTITPSWSKTRKWWETNWRVKMLEKKKPLTKANRRKKSGMTSKKRQESPLCRLLVQAKMMNLWKSDITESSIFDDYIYKHDHIFYLISSNRIQN